MREREGEREENLESLLSRLKAGDGGGGEEGKTHKLWGGRQKREKEFSQKTNSFRLKWYEKMRKAGGFKLSLSSKAYV